MNITILQPLKKQLQKHILSFVPTAKIESIRFRSIPFQVPTTKLPDSDEGDSKSKGETRAHAKERSSNWRAKQGDIGEEGVKSDEKKYLTPAQKKKIAYINQEFHTTADVVNAYIVFEHPKDAADRPANLPPLPSTLDPYQAAQQAADEGNGSVFMDRVLRVDLVGKGKTTVGKVEAISFHDGDPRLSIFVGNLEFAAKEEDLRDFFEGLMCAERGPPGQSVDSCGEEAPNPTRKPLTWVTRIRIVRDNATQLGRGFAYLEFMVCTIDLLRNF
jgi:nucleolar protein 12